MEPSSATIVYLIIIHPPDCRVRQCHTLSSEVCPKSTNVHLTQQNTRHSPNVVLMLGRRRRRRANIKTTLGECLVFDWQYTYHIYFLRTKHTEIKLIKLLL